MHFASKQFGKLVGNFDSWSTHKDMPLHWCEKGHIGCVLEGRFEIRFPGEVHVYNEGDGVFIPAGAEHKHMGRALTDMVRVVFVEEVQGG